MQDAFPPRDELLQMSPNEVTPLLLKYLKENEPAFPAQKINRHNVLLDAQNSFGDNGQGNRINPDAASKVIAEAWGILETESFLAHYPGESGGDFYFVTRKGLDFSDEDNLQAYEFSKLLGDYGLDRALERHVRPLYNRGDYDTAVFRAYKEVEVRIRSKANLPDTLIGVNLARQAFHPDTGPLTEMSVIDKGERESRMQLFAGALGTFKNPSSHRNVDFDNPREVAEIILFANYLIRIAEGLPAIA